MKLKDIEVFETIFALFTISHCADMMFDEIEESDLPEESLREGYRSVRESIHSLVESLEHYRDDNLDTFLSACDE